MSEISNQRKRGKSQGPFKTIRLARVNPKETNGKILSKSNENLMNIQGLANSNTSQIIQLLKQFDMTLKYGPCVGKTRLERWNRAKVYALDPPIKVLEILKNENLSKVIPDINLSLWHKELD